VPNSVCKNKKVVELLLDSLSLYVEKGDRDGEDFLTLSSESLTKPKTYSLSKPILLHLLL
jgi:hypothetical protein